MTKTDGIEDLVKTVQKEIPIAKAKNTDEMWEKFLRIVFVGGGRGDAEAIFLVKSLGADGLASVAVFFNDGLDYAYLAIG